MASFKLARPILNVYRQQPPLIQRKAEFTLVILLLLTSLILVQGVIWWFWDGFSWMQLLRDGASLSLVAVSLVHLLRKRLEGAVNTLALVCVLNSLFFFNAEVSRHFFVFNLFSMMAFTILAVRLYQRIIVFIIFPALVAAKGFYEFAQASAGTLTRETGAETLLTLLIFVAAIPLAQLLLSTVGREIRHSDTLLRINKDLKEEAGTDRLTGAWNRRQFEHLIRRETSEALRTARPLVLAMFDLDHFKQVNDHWGHQTGDEVLAEVVRTVQATLRSGDSLIRWGGDEFVVLCPGAGLDHGRQLGEKILEAVEHNAFLCEIGLGVSAGIAVWRPGEPAGDLLGRADHLLYLAKEGGRNRVFAEDLAR